MFRVTLAIVATLCLCLPALGQTDPTPAQLQQIDNDVAALTAATTADQAALALIATDTAAVTAAQATLATDTTNQQATAAGVSASIAQLVTDVDALNVSPQTKAKFITQGLAGVGASAAKAPFQIPIHGGFGGGGHGGFGGGGFLPNILPYILGGGGFGGGGYGGGGYGPSPYYPQPYPAYYPPQPQPAPVVGPPVAHTAAPAADPWHGGYGPHPYPWGGGYGPSPYGYGHWVISPITGQYVWVP